MKEGFVTRTKLVPPAAAIVATLKAEIYHERDGMLCVRFPAPTINSRRDFYAFTAEERAAFDQLVRGMLDAAAVALHKAHQATIREIDRKAAAKW